MVVSAPIELAVEAGDEPFAPHPRGYARACETPDLARAPFLIELPQMILYDTVSVENEEISDTLYCQVVKVFSILLVWLIKRGSRKVLPVNKH